MEALALQQAVAQLNAIGAIPAEGGPDAAELAELLQPPPQPPQLAQPAVPQQPSQAMDALVTEVRAAAANLARCGGLIAQGTCWPTCSRTHTHTRGMQMLFGSVLHAV